MFRVPAYPFPFLFALLGSRFTFLRIPGSSRSTFVRTLNREQPNSNQNKEPWNSERGTRNMERLVHAIDAGSCLMVVAAACRRCSKSCFQKNPF
jgi:hypothetical protein